MSRTHCYNNLITKSKDIRLSSLLQGKREQEFLEISGVCKGRLPKTLMIMVCRVWNAAGPGPNGNLSWDIFIPLNNCSLPMAISALMSCNYEMKTI